MKWIVLVIMFALPAISIQLSAQGNLLITPKRVLFEGNKQNEELNLVNLGSDTTTFSISFLQYNMTEDGNLVRIDKPGEGQRFADPYLRIFPRKVTLAPNESQVVRLQLKHAADMLPGEYRSHIYFRSEKNYKAAAMEVPLKDTNLMSVQLIPVYGLCIPVIIHVGDVNATAKLSDLKVEMQQDSIPDLKLVINRKGNMSVYGEFSVEYFPMKGKPVIIGEARGVAVYTTTDKRNYSMRLNNAKHMNLAGGKIVVRYTSPKDAPYVLYDQQELTIASQDMSLR